MSNTNSPEREDKRAIDASILKRFGLTANDVRVYQSLFRIGRTRTGAIIKETGVANSRVYASLQNLINRGLVSYQVKNNVKYYQAELPETLIERVKRDSERLKDLSSMLSKLPAASRDRNETNTFEGVRGLKMAYQQHLEGLERGEKTSIIAFVGTEFIESGELRDFFAKTVDTTLIKKRCTGRMITHQVLKSIIEHDRPDSSIYDIRFLPNDHTLPYTLNISKKEVMMTVWNANPMVFSMKNPTVVEAFQKNFDYLWTVAKKR